jgi:hypothetical protein
MYFIIYKKGARAPGKKEKTKKVPDWESRDF